MNNLMRGNPKWIKYLILLVIGAATEESLRSSESSIATQNQLDGLLSSQLQLAAASAAATHSALDACA